MSNDRKRLVIDTSIMCMVPSDMLARGKPRRARDFLDNVLNICHRCVATPSITCEWDRPQEDGYETHLTAYAMNWRLEMTNLRKMILVPEPERSDLREQIADAVDDVGYRNNILKDVHLLEAALVTDKTVISGDKTAKSAYRRLAKTIPCLGGIIWVNPLEEREQAVEWLKRGAPPEKERMLYFEKPRRLKKKKGGVS